MSRPKGWRDYIFLALNPGMRHAIWGETTQNEDFFSKFEALCILHAQAIYSLYGVRMSVQDPKSWLASLGQVQLVKFYL